MMDGIKFEGMWHISDSANFKKDILGKELVCGGFM
jgi:hypothetical protein